jgi:putative peptidoglycan lipid II flippase
MMTGQALIAYSLGLVGLIVVKVLAPGFYARQDIRTPVRIGVMTLVATQIMNLMFYRPLQHAGLALAIGLGACINAGLLYYKLRRGAVFQPQPGWRKFFVQLGAALLAMGLTLWFASGSAASWLEGSVWMRAARLAAVVIVGAVVYFAALWLGGIRPAQFAKRAQ